MGAGANNPGTKPASGHVQSRGAILERLRGEDMFANDMKQGTVVRLRGTGWRATIVDNAKGLVRLADVEGLYRETGSIYVHDIAYVESADGPEPLELSKAQAKQDARIRAAGF